MIRITSGEWKGRTLKTPASQKTRPTQATNSAQTELTQTDLTQAQKDALSYIIQEEKLARDVYTTMYQTWNNKKFYNILNAEENHQARAAQILEAYNLPNPVTDKDR